MRIPPWLVISEMHFYQGSMNYPGTHTQIVTPDPARIYLAFFQPKGADVRVFPDGFTGNTFGYSINASYNYIEFTFEDNPGLVGLGWWFVVGTPIAVDWLAIAWKPEG